MPPEDAALIATVTAVIVGMIAAHRHGDAPGAMREVERLLRAVAQYSNATFDERPGDPALRRAVLMRLP